MAVLHVKRNRTASKHTEEGNHGTTTAIEEEEKEEEEEDDVQKMETTDIALTIQ